MDAGSAKRLISLAAGILVSYFIAEIVSDAVVLTFALTGAAGLIVGMVIFAAVFFGVISLVQKYAGIRFFSGFLDR